MGQRREVEVMYGYDPLCPAKKINLNEVIYYLWQVSCTKIVCQSECLLISHTALSNLWITIVHQR